MIPLRQDVVKSFPAGNFLFAFALACYVCLDEKPTRKVADFSSFSDEKNFFGRNHRFCNRTGIQIVQMNGYHKLGMKIEGMVEMMNRMKRWMSGLLALVLLLAMNVACAEEEFPYHEFVPVEDGDQIVIYDGETLTVRFKVHVSDENKASYTLQINDGEPIAGRFQAYEAENVQMRALNTYNGLYFFIYLGFDSGCYYNVYEYYDGHIYCISDYFWCNATLDEFQATNSGTFIADTWTFTPLGCFNRAQEYVIASTHYKMRYEGWPYMSGIFELPRGLYPIGNVVQLTQDLPLLTSREDGAETITISAGSYVALVGTDCEKWGYLTEISEEGNYNPISGWVQFAPNSYSDILINGQAVDAEKYMDGIAIGG